MDIEAKCEARGELVNLQAALETGIDIGQAIGKREGQFLYGGRASLADMIAADADGVPLRHVARAEFDGIHHQARRWLGREEELFLRNVLFQDVVLQRTAQ